MSKRDDQLDDELRQVLQDAPPPAASSDARRRAIAMARAGFESHQAEKARKQQTGVQGFIRRLRLIVRNSTDRKRRAMNIHQTFAYGGIATIAVAVIAVGVTLRQQFAEPGLALLDPSDSQFSSKPAKSSSTRNARAFETTEFLGRQAKLLQEAADSAQPTDTAANIQRRAHGALGVYAGHIPRRWRERRVCHGTPGGRP